MATNKTKTSTSKAATKKVNEKILFDNYQTMIAAGDNECKLGKNERDHQKAFEQYHLAASHGSAEGMFQLSICYRFGRGCAENIPIALGLLESAAEKGNKDAQYQLGSCYEDWMYDYVEDRIKELQQQKAREEDVSNISQEV